MAKRDNRLTISDLSRELGISKSTVHGITQTLEGIGAIVRNGETRCYTLGMTLLELAHTVYTRIDLKDVAQPDIGRSDAIHAAERFLGIRSGDRVSIVDIIESAQDLKITAHIGARLPLLVGATGKVFMASLPENEAAQLIRTAGLRQDTERSVADPDSYIEEIRKVRKSGYALTMESTCRGSGLLLLPSMHRDGRLRPSGWLDSARA